MNNEKIHQEFKEYQEISMCLQVTYFIITICMTIIACSLAITTICEEEMCGWDKTECNVYDLIIREVEQNNNNNDIILYELYGIYEETYSYLTYCYGEGKELFIESNANKTYLENLWDTEYTLGSEHLCWIRDYYCGLKNKNPYDRDKMMKLLYSTATFMFISSIMWILPFLSRFNYLSRKLRNYRVIE